LFFSQGAVKRRRLRQQTNEKAINVGAGKTERLASEEIAFFYYKQISKNEFYKIQSVNITSKKKKNKDLKADQQAILFLGSNCLYSNKFATSLNK
jgi:hypothetical protein